MNMIKTTPGPWLPHAAFPAILVSMHASTTSLLMVDAAGAARFINPDDCRLASAAHDTVGALDLALRTIPAEAIKSSTRAVMEMAIMKAGYPVPAPKHEPPTHYRICGENL
ncbi:acetyl-CoA carboxylase [Burkholderia arboris]|uniref:acetyl-CoA carboxylase n=1 Tax=Burkholderia arboris TaxID=488730 RepID=UPI001CF15B4A|nr:acetyl-CoA carboxylase [Burkholderia arboris]MCA8045519.1 acetyl-CoA carboxylase [Burkholderia arboris]